MYLPPPPTLKTQPKLFALGMHTRHAGGGIMLCTILTDGDTRAAHRFLLYDMANTATAPNTTFIVFIILIVYLIYF